MPPKPSTVASAGPPIQVLVVDNDPAHAEAKKPAEPSKADKHAFLQALSKARERWNGREVRA